MNHLCEKYAMYPVLAPQSVNAAESATSEYADMQLRDRFAFAVELGTVAADKSVKVELLSTDDSSGAGARTEGDITYTAPTGGAAKHLVLVCGRVAPDRGRYLAVKATNNGSAAVVLGAVLMCDSMHWPEDAGATTLVV